MDKNSKIGSAHLQIPISDKTVVTELSGDFILPDYQPEIKRLLRVVAAVLPPSKYISDREAELAGGIDYYVYYLGSDNMLYCAPLSTEYKINMPFESDCADSNELLQPVGGGAVIVPDMISGRVTAPRKLNIKCRLKSRVQVFGDMPIEDGYSHGEDGLQVLRGSVMASECLRGVSDIVRVSDEVISDSREGDVRVISAEGRALMSEVNAIEDAVVCRGDLHLKLMLCREGEGIPYVVVRKLQLSATVPLEGARSGDVACAKGSVCELNVTVEEGRVLMESGVMIEAQAAHIEAVEYVKDVYSISRKSDNSYKNVSVPSDMVCFGGNFTLSDSLSLDESGIPHGSRIIDACGRATVEEYSFDDGKCAISGKASFSMLTEKDGEFGAYDVDLPFSYRISTKSDASKAMCECEVIAVRARADGERVGIDAEIGVVGSAYATKVEKMLSSASFGDEMVSPRGEIVVCYPSNEDTLWSVAKRYGAEVDQLKNSNKLPLDKSPDSQESLEKTNFLVI